MPAKPVAKDPPPLIVRTRCVYCGTDYGREHPNARYEAACTCNLLPDGERKAVILDRLAVSVENLCEIASALPGRNKKR